MNERICWLWVQARLSTRLGGIDECASLCLLSKRLTDPLVPVQAGRDLCDSHVISLEASVTPQRPSDERRGSACEPLSVHLVAVSGAWVSC